MQNFQTKKKIIGIGGIISLLRQMIKMKENSVQVAFKIMVAMKWVFIIIDNI